jgi:hypothetical protein
MDSNLENPFSEHYIPEQSHVLKLSPERLGASKVQALFSKDISGDSVHWERQAHVRLGSCEFVEKGSRMGISYLAREQAASVGASIVLFQFTPAKVRAIRRGEDGRIDMSSVRADPPASLSPRGTYVVQAVFMASLVGESEA